VRAVCCVVSIAPSVFNLGAAVFCMHHQLLYQCTLPLLPTESALPVALLLTASALTYRLFACLVMASKVWDDLSMWNVVSGVSAVSLHRLVLSGDVRF
jgi:hypothetical protein